MRSVELMAFALLASLAGCAPTASSAGIAAHPLLVPGGTVEAGWATLDGRTFPLPGQPRLAGRHGHRLYVAYAYRLLVFENGELTESFSLPGIPRFLKVYPRLVVGLGGGVLVPERGLLAYPAQDALARADGVFWVDSRGFWRERTLLHEGDYRWVVGNEAYAWALGHKAYRYPDGLTFPLPFIPRAAAVWDDLYLLGEAGVARLSPEGLRLGFRPGQYAALAVDASGVWLLKDGRPRRLTFALEEP